MLLKVMDSLQGVSEEYQKCVYVDGSLIGAGKWLLGVAMGLFTALGWHRAAP